MKNKNQKFFEKLKTLESPDCTYQPDEYPIILSKAKGSYVWDVENKKYIDLCAGFGSLALGHSHKSLQQMLQKFLRTTPPLVQGFSDVYASKIKIELLNAIKSFLPEYLTKGALMLSGSQAVEYALKTAIMSSKKSGFISFKGAYHGLDWGAMHCTHEEYFKKPFKNFMNTKNIIFCDYNDTIEKLEEQIYQAYKQLTKNGLGVAAVIVEPIQGRCGVRIPSKQWLNTLYELCKKLKILLIFDEIYTAFGRCGVHSFSHTFECDIVCLGKALGGGFPLSACFAKEHVMIAWPNCKSEALHTGTFFGHPFCAHAAIAFLKEYTRLQLHKKALTIGTKAIDYLKYHLKDLDIVNDVRGQGLMIAIEFNKPNVGVKLMEELRKNGVIAIASGFQGESITLTPPLNIEWKILQKGCDKIINCCKTICN